jgi:hypothetical protein
VEYVYTPKTLATIHNYTCDIPNTMGMIIGSAYARLGIIARGKKNNTPIHFIDKLMAITVDDTFKAFPLHHH